MTEERSSDTPLSGSIPYVVGQASIVRIPIPGTNRLAVELRPRGWVPRSGSTSTLFIQDITGKRHLRLDFGPNTKTQTIDYHWNQRGIKSGPFAIPDHTALGPPAGLAYRSLKYFKHLGRVFVVGGAAIEIVSIAQADRPIRRASQAVAGMAAAWAGCKVVGAGGAAVGTLASPAGTAVGAIAGCIIGGAAGYYAGSEIAGVVYDWGEDTVFRPLQMTRSP